MESVRPCKASTIRKRRTDLVSFAKKTVRLNVPIESLISLAALIDPALVDKVVDSEWQKAGNHPKTTTIDLGKKLLRWTGLPRSSPEQLEEIRATLEKERQGGNHPKEHEAHRQVLNGNVWASVVNYPTDLMKRARALKDQAPMKAAVTAEIAVAIAIETVARSGRRTRRHPP